MFLNIALKNRSNTKTEARVDNQFYPLHRMPCVLSVLPCFVQVCGTMTTSKKIKIKLAVVFSGSVQVPDFLF